MPSKGFSKQPPMRCWLRPWWLENLILPAILGHHLCEHLHTTTHLGEKKTLTLLQTACLRFPRQNATVREIIQACKASQLMRTGKRQHTGTRHRGEEPGQHWEIDFTEVRPGRRDWALGSLQSRAASHPGRTGKGASRMGHKTSPVKSFETETHTTGALLTLLLITVFIGPGATSHNPH